MKAYIYCRVSKSTGRRFGSGRFRASFGSANPTNSANSVFSAAGTIDAQTDECVRYCREQGWLDEDIVIYNDEQSGREGTNIPSLRLVLDEMDSGDTLIVYTTDRLSRHALEGVQFLEELNEKGCRIVSVSENITYDQDDIYGRFGFRNILNHAELESDRLSTRIKRAAKSKRNVSSYPSTSSTRFQCKTVSKKQRCDALSGTHRAYELNTIAQHNRSSHVMTRSMIRNQNQDPYGNSGSGVVSAVGIVGVDSVADIDGDTEMIDIDQMPSYAVDNSLIKGVLSNYTT